MFAVPLVPEIADRLALEGEVDNKGQPVCGQRADDRPADVCKLPGDLLREDAKVEKDD